MGLEDIFKNAGVTLADERVVQEKAEAVTLDAKAVFDEKNALYKDNKTTMAAEKNVGVLGNVGSKNKPAKPNGGENISDAKNTHVKKGSVLHNEKTSTANKTNEKERGADSSRLIQKLKNDNQNLKNMSADAHEYKDEIALLKQIKEELPDNAAKQKYVDQIIGQFRDLPNDQGAVMVQALSIIQSLPNGLDEVVRVIYLNKEGSNTKK